ncbi:rod shape-determining protein [Candidatus Berkelbacteria bacterium CG_4_9_14_3_um_filter_39_23]|uniref:Cell shape-determining protein MreB n=2 Tax=Candidatus Berkelbacteria TaxID=1618330 RepID=A0A2M7CIW8_9BACT|nr:rod shape-determining protein [Candidatus Berkelbacteria bacterium]OIP04910.1 MAG: rod shape-determining protein [Candidatus Berkelbacteria bacterium CG2_30_39_44]PIR27600.1 MAG: rod shape-determining protein [Candidatus Berkelbacteria bacterium CG11_big_fil_rev_8_21_14_0_20_40_23]PIV25559.1 MAG: rod shape-determining protein [Candidatus Berkelbacteria bacterium CG03_land_8_20_14_0_80_40_36]PIX30772.1 MAG: rod shape-determining protein [Candidatus Berkelbacteria bacterium CG_4_8_14_3_um_filt
MFNKIFGLLSQDMAIDLGTANTLVYVKDRGIVINEPSVVAINNKTKQILAIGEEARRMVGKTPAYIVAIRPLVDGVVSDFEITEEMLRYFITRVHHEKFTFFPRPRVIIGIPYGVTEVERRAVEEAGINAGAREVYLIEEPLAAAIGAKMSIQEPGASFIVDIGGGTTEVAVISLGGIVTSRSVRVAGDEMDQDIVNWARDQHNLLIGERTAEEIKIQSGSALAVDEKLLIKMRGRDLVLGLPKEIAIPANEIHEALQKSVKIIVKSVKDTLEETPPELVADILDKGIILAGGGANLKGLDRLLADATKTKVHIASDPLTAVVRGAGMVLEDLDSLSAVLLPSEYKHRQ